VNFWGGEREMVTPVTHLSCSVGSETESRDGLLLVTGNEREPAQNPLVYEGTQKIAASKRWLLSNLFALHRNSRRSLHVRGRGVQRGPGEDGRRKRAGLSENCHPQRIIMRGKRSID